MVLLTRSGAEHCYVANRLAKAFRLQAILVDIGAALSWKRRLKLAVRGHTRTQLWSRALLKLWLAASRDSAQRRHDMELILGEDACSHRFPELIRMVRGINSPDTLAVLAELAPDVLLIYGTAVAGPQTLASASRLVLNLHTGMSPRYRGAQCAFWPLYRGEVDQIGATVHVCTKDIDGGPILAQAATPLEENDTIHMVFARTVKLGASLYAEAIRKALAGDRGQPQDLSTGIEYRSAMKGIMAEWIVRRRIREGMVRSYVRSRAAVL